MTTRRTTTTKVEVPMPNSSPPSNPTNTHRTTELDSPPPAGSPFLPTALEALLLAIYPATLLLGSLFSLLHPAARHAPYLPHAQSYDPSFAPSYFARKSNAFNVYFVKIGWFWVSLAFAGLVLGHGSFRGGSGVFGVGRKKVQALARYACVTAVWIAVTQWFFGPPIIDRSFRWTGGQCEVFSSAGMDDVAKMAERAEMGEVREVLTHAACKAIGGQWKGGHDISGHVFLLILGSAMLWLEILPAVLRAEGLREARRVWTWDGLVRSAALEAKELGGDETEVGGEGRPLSAGVKGALVVVGLSWWMLLMTAAYFHTWFEKFTGLTVAFAALWAVYFLPRAVPGVRRVVGMPGV